ncbi:protein phosphatase 2C domain-containing protein [Streptomyces sp. NPDC086787]|uniref:protein phosphatase 2C domain-containing protein n=1 Tax=Streptomyces sp. NPDC086787 TaxID=3365759 RepID=UPI0038117A59
MTALVLGVLLAASVVVIALLRRRMRAQAHSLRGSAEAERAQQYAVHQADRARSMEEWRAERAALMSAVSESGGQLEQARAAVQASDARAEQALAQQASAERELTAIRAARAAAEAEVRLLKKRLEEVEDAVPPTARASTPAVPRELPLGRDSAADSVVDGADLGPLVVRAASVRGARHREDREHRRDAVQLRLAAGFGAPVLLSAVAAGDPDALLSQSGATAACRTLVTQLSSGANLFTNGPFAEDDDPSIGPALRSVLAGVANSVRLVARANTAGVVTARDDAHVTTSLYGLLSELGDRRERRHLVFGIGDVALLRLRVEGEPGNAPRWTTLVTPDPALASRRLPGVAPDGSDIVRLRVVTRPGDVLVLASGPMAQLLGREEVAEWFARRWHGRQPFLTTFLSDVNANIADKGGDRSLVCLWDHGHAAALTGAGAARWS